MLSTPKQVAFGSKRDIRGTRGGGNRPGVVAAAAGGLSSHVPAPESTRLSRKQNGSRDRGTMRRGRRGTLGENVAIRQTPSDRKDLNADQRRGLQNLMRCALNPPMPASAFGKISKKRPNVRKCHATLLPLQEHICRFCAVCTIPGVWWSGAADRRAPPPRDHYDTRRTK